MQYKFFDNREEERAVWFLDGDPGAPVMILRDMIRNCLCRPLDRDDVGFVERDGEILIPRNRLHAMPSLGDLLL